MGTESYAALLIAFAVSMVLYPGVIDMLRRLKAGQIVSTDGPQAHLTKQGTPTMGGILIVLVGSVIALAVSLWIVSRSLPDADFVLQRTEIIGKFLLPLVLLFLGFGFLGFLDDYLIIKKGKALGLRAREKLLGQFILAGLFVAWLGHTQVLGPATTQFLLGKGFVSLGSFYYVIAVLYIVGFSNAVNIADGLDGLVGGMSTITAGALALGVISVVGAASAGLFAGSVILCFTIAGACLAFLWYNANPAKVFMGDTGSLALGAVFAGIAIMTKQEVALLVYGLMFIIEIGSIVLQSGYFKYTRRKYGEGRRIFKMSPLHHHFELAGWPEQLVVFRFWILSAIFAAIGLLGRVWRLW